MAEKIEESKRKNQTWVFKNPPCIIASAAVGGEREKESPLAADYDFFFENNRAGTETFEQAEVAFMDQACHMAIEKSAVARKDIDLFVAGDLINQVTPSNFTARGLYLPFLGLFNACATAAEGLAIAAMAISAGYAEYVLTGASSHNRGAERQFRYPTEYGCQIAESAQTTATAAGVGLLAREFGGSGVKVKAATIGRVVDWGVSDPMNMGAAMAPAAAATIYAHFEDTGLRAEDYDLIVTGDLGKYGHQLVSEILENEGVRMIRERFDDCGKLLFPPGKQNFAGGSGAGCVASVLYGHLLKRMAAGEFRRLLVVATGALLSPNTCKQHESIPAIAHAIALEKGV